MLYHFGLWRGLADCAGRLNGSDKRCGNASSREGQRLRGIDRDRRERPRQFLAEDEAASAAEQEKREQQASMHNVALSPSHRRLLA
jgi:hypothetical protein